MANPGPQGLDCFAGAWRLSRHITDNHVGQTGHAEGRMILSPDGESLVYDERTTLRLPGAPHLQGTRSYRWHAAAGGIAVRFVDGRAFHAIALDTARPEDVHLCGADRYAVRYDFADWPVWCVTWVVTGPRKDYRMETLFARDGSVDP